MFTLLMRSDSNLMTQTWRSGTCLSSEKACSFSSFSCSRTSSSVGIESAHKKQKNTSASNKLVIAVFRIASLALICKLSPTRALTSASVTNLILLFFRAAFHFVVPGPVFWPYIVRPGFPAIRCVVLPLTDLRIEPPFRVIRPWILPHARCEARTLACKQMKDTTAIYTHFGSCQILLTRHTSTLRKAV